MRTRWTASIGALPLVLLAAAGCTRDADLAKRDHLARGDHYAAEGRFAEAVIEYRNAIQLDPRWGEARYKLAETYVRDNDPARAVPEYIRAADLLPRSVDAQLKAGHMLLLGRQFEEARARADAVLTIDPHHVQALILRGNALAGSSDVEGALAQLEEAARLDPGSSATLQNIAALHLERGDEEAAEASLRSAIQLDNRSVSARLALAVFLLSSGRSQEAETTLDEALALEPLNLAANRLQALLHLTSDRATDAERYLKTVAEQSGKPAATLALADYYMFMRRVSDATRVLHGVKDADPATSTAVQTRLAEIAYRDGNKTEAHQRVDGILAGQLASTPARLFKANLLLQEGRLDEALAHATEAVQAESSRAEAHFVLGQIKAAMHRFGEAATAFADALRVNPRATATQLALARVHLARGDAPAAADAARETLKAWPDHDEAGVLLLQALIAMRDFAQAAREANALLVRHPQRGALHAQLGALRLAQGDDAAAEPAFRRALELEPAAVDALSGLVKLDLRARRFAAARERFEARLLETPHDTALVALASTAYDLMGDREGAELVLTRALESQPDNPEVLERLGELYLDHGKFDEAKAMLERLTARLPNSDTERAARTTIGVILQSQNRPDEAQAIFERVLAVAPQNVIAANNLAWLYAERGIKLDVALSLAQTAVQLAPDEPVVNDTLGWIYHKKGFSGLALEAFRRCLDKDAGNPIYHYHLGLAQWQHGDATNAIASLKKALSLDADFDGASDARRVLATLQK